MVAQTLQAVETLKGIAHSLGITVEQPPRREFRVPFSLAEVKTEEELEEEAYQEKQEFRRKRAHRDFYITRLLRGMLLDKQFGPSPDHWKGAEYELKVSLEATQRALSEGVDTAGGFIVPPEYADEIIELLRDEAVVRAAGARIVPMRTNVVYIARRATGSTAYWLGENATIPSSDLTLGQVALVAKKLAALVETSRELILDAGADAEALIRDDIVEAISAEEDRAFLVGDGTGAEPVGIGNISGVQSTALGALTFEDFSTLRRLLKTAKSRYDSTCRWFADPLVEEKILNLKDANGQPIFLPSLQAGVEGLPILGRPLLTTNVMPDDELWLVRMRDVVIGQRAGIEIAMSGEAGNYFAKDQIGIRAIERVDINLRHVESVVKGTGIT